MTLAVGSRLGHYAVVAPLGSGGMGDVYRATDTKLGRAVALKVISAEMAAHPDRLDRFRREAKALEWAARVADQRNPIFFQSTIRPFQHVLSRSPRWPALLQKLNLSR